MEYAQVSRAYMFKTRRDFRGLCSEQLTFVNELRSCRDLIKGKHIHERIRGSRFCNDTFLANLVLQMYGRCGSPQDARRVFDRIHPLNCFSWSIMMNVYAQNGHVEETKHVFDKMPRRDLINWTSMVAAFGQADNVSSAKEAFDAMPERDVISWNVMLNAYAQTGYIKDSRKMFDRMPRQSLVSWNSMISAYAEAGKMEKVKLTFQKMPERDVISWNVSITALAQNGHLYDAKKILSLMPETSMVSWTAMLIAHGQNGCIEEARDIFNRMPEKDVLTGTAMIVAFAQNGELGLAKETFDDMPIHSIYPWNAMVAAYAQNGRIQEAMNTFMSMPERDSISWSAILAVHAQNRHAKDTIFLFETMNLEGFKPDEVCYLIILIACSRIGMVEKGRCYFVSMTPDYGIRPVSGHYSCMIDLLGRAGELDDAEELINNMPYVPDDVAWVSLVGACRVYRDVIRGAGAGQSLMKLRPERAGAYVVISNVYATAGRQEDVATVRKMMKERVGKLSPGVSTVQIGNVVHKFTVGDTSHPLNDEIRAELQRLNKLMESEGYVPETKEVLHAVSEEEKEQLLGDHSEKLAIALGLISTPAGSVLRVIKNLRVCLDCHAVTKLISKITERKIVVRDSNRYHIFENGTCTCEDYW